MAKSITSTPTPPLSDVPTDPRSKQISSRRFELVQSISSLNYVITEQERKIEHLKLQLDEETNKLVGYQDELRNLKSEKTLMSKAQKVVNTKKRRLAVDDFNDQLDDYLNEHEDGKCCNINDRNRKCTKWAVRELEGRAYCKQHYDIIAERRLNYYQSKLH
jgi:uncharacterized coiled-coil protein SlyX